MATGSRSETLVIDASYPGERLDTFLRENFPGISRGAIQRLIEEGHVKVDGRKVKPTHNPRKGETITIHFPEARAAEAQPEEIPLEILHEDADLLVINKEAGLVVHPAVGNEEHTIVNALLHHCKGQLSGIGGVARPGIVHRLDKETSGCLVVAKNDRTHLGLAEQFSGRSVQKTYLAIVCGDIARDTGSIRAAIARHPTHRKRMTVNEGEGREALTSYKVLERLRGATYLEIQIHTGRTHQIRVHFEHLGYPVFGDDTYGAKQTRRLSELTGYKPPRVLLHAWKLAFNHPATGTPLSMAAPIPHDMMEALACLR